MSLAARDAVPVMYSVRDPVAAGGLMSYGTSNSEMYGRIHESVGKVLNGANPAEMPVLQPTNLPLVINLKTANALGLKVSDDLLSLADKE